MSVQGSIIQISVLQCISYSADGPWVTCKFRCTHRQFNMILIKLFTSAECAGRQRRDPGRGFWGQSVGPEGMTKKTCGSVFLEILELLKKISNFTLEVLIFRKTEHRQPIKLCVHWGIPVSWHDNLLFKCTAAFLPYITEQSRQLIHYHWAPFFSPSYHFLTRFPPFCSPRPLSVAAPLWKPYCVLLLNLQTALDKEQQCKSQSARSSSWEGGYQGDRYLEVLSVVKKS